ncbi:ABC transporter permease [Clostridium sp. CCUG 7971]|uniref:ABC transporter permease n=1 Tax=Clostridium sp. CCUG 7971 TaxID=2811414 RepID=UPI001ABB2C5F|nr:ABC transporter permease [Clostridium sp. CCUG 7971]MBO3446249.1 FtsX-like permease family protein [Clostridium sp. CCUG 7971]
MKLNDIVKRYIMENKKNTSLIIISIIISTALFLVMNIISEDARNLMIDQAKKELGIHYASYYNPTNKDIKNIENNPSIDKIGKSMLLGLHDIGNGQTLQILWDDKIAQEVSNSYKLQKGKFPTNENEIAVDTWYIEQNNIKNSIGKTIKLDYSKPDENGHESYTGEKEFKIVGILQSNPLLKAQGMSLGVISKECTIKNIPDDNKYNQVMFTFKKDKNIPKQVEKLVEDENLNKNNMRLNNPLILAMSDSLSLKIPYIIINIILALATILLIYNIFYTLVSNRTKDFGTLRSLGFDPKDISKIMILEVFIYSVISIPIGLILGYLIANSSREYVIGVIYDVSYANSIKSKSYINTYVITILLSVLTIIISVFKPLILSIKIDPIICMRRNQEKININKKSLINKFMTKFFKDYGNIASKNLQRNKKRTSLAIASMTLVIFLMATVYTKSTSNFLDSGGMRLWIPGEYSIQNIDPSSTIQNEKSYDIKILKEIEHIDGVKKVNALRDKHFNIKTDDNNINKKSEYWKMEKFNLEQNAEIKNGVKVYKNNFEVLGIEDTEVLNDVLIGGKENLSKLNKEPYIYINNATCESINIKMGDKVNVNFDTVDSKTGNYKETISKEFIVGGIIKHLPIFSQGGGTSFEAVISVNQMNKFTGISSYERFDVWTSKLANEKHVERELNKIVEKSGKGILIPYKSESAEFEKSNNQKAMIMILVVGVITILSLFNCCNTIVTSINSRSREFALFRGIGISKDEIKKIVKLEAMVYIAVSFIISIIPSLIVRSIIIKDFENIKLINFSFVMAIVIIVAILSTIIIITISRALKKVQTKDFIDQIKNL